jgi:hypothetical protein
VHPHSPVCFFGASLAGARTMTAAFRYTKEICPE